MSIQLSQQGSRRYEYYFSFLNQLHQMIGANHLTMDSSSNETLSIPTGSQSMLIIFKELDHHIYQLMNVCVFTPNFDGAQVIFYPLLKSITNSFVQISNQTTNSVLWAYTNVNSFIRPTCNLSRNVITFPNKNDCQYIGIYVDVQNLMDYVRSVDAGPDPIPDDNTYWPFAILTFIFIVFILLFVFVIIYWTHSSYRSSDDGSLPSIEE